MDKNAIRDSFLLKRQSLKGSFIETASLKIAKLLRDSGLFKGQVNVLTYLALKKEVQTNIILDFLVRAKKKVYVPAFVNEGWIVSRYYPGEELTKGYYGTLQPLNIKIEETSNIDITLVPGVAFNKDGARIGFGAGAYDRLLAKMRTKKIGLCFDFQIVDSIIPQPHDVAMDYICSERRLIKVT